MLDAFLRAATTSNFKWYHPSRYTNLFPSKATPRAIILSSPHIPWYLLDEREDLVQRWAAVVSAAPYTEEFARNVVEALFWIASRKALLSHIPFNAWSWLTKRPSLPPVCGARFFGTYPDVFKTVQELNDIEVLKSYLTLVWSEWDPLQDGGFDEMCVSIPKHFGRTEMGHHRADLIQRLDHILEQLDQGTGHLMQRNPHFREDSFGQMKDQYGKLKDILLGANVEAIARRSDPVIALLCILIRVGMVRVSKHVYVHSSPPIPLTLHLEPSTSRTSLPQFIPTTDFDNRARSPCTSPYPLSPRRPMKRAPPPRFLTSDR